MILLSLLLSKALASTPLPPTAFPVFLKEGFSSILEFEEAPTQVVLGDQNLFQIEKLNQSIVVKALVPYAVTNLFVYFKTKETRLFILTAAEDVEPTYYKKFVSIIPRPALMAASVIQRKYSLAAILKEAKFDKNKDYLTIDLEISASSTGKVIPSWDLIRLKYKDKTIAPSKLWSERREVQKDSAIKARLIFTKPNIPADFKETSVAIPLKGSVKSLSVNLNGAKL